MSNSPFTTDPVRTAIALAYMNLAFIADSVLPRRPVGAENFEYVSYNKEDRFTIPDTTVDRKGRLNQVEFGGKTDSAMTNDYGLEDVIPAKDIKNGQNAGFDPLGNATELTLDLIMLDREKRVSGLVQDENTYEANMRATLTGTDQWDDSASKPIEQIEDAKLVPFMTPNVMVTNRKSLLALRRNQSIVRAYHGNTGSDGMVPVSFLEELFELRILVGAARYNSANKGQTMTLTELWGNHCSLHYINGNAMPNRGLTFGLTAQYESRIVRTKQDDNVGLRGATVLQVGESVKELILASDTAYFFKNVLAP